MLDIKDILSNEIETTLLSVDYKIIPDTDLDNDMDVEYYDEVEINEVTDDKVEFYITRYVKFVPESFFDIKIKFSIERYLNEDFKDEAKLSDYDLIDEFKKDSGLFTKYREGWISLLISQLTSTFSNSPLVTPPMLCLKND